MVRMHVRVVRHTCTHTSGGVDHARARIGSPEWHPFQTGPQEQITPILRTTARTHTRPLCPETEDLKLSLSIRSCDFTYRLTSPVEFTPWMFAIEYYMNTNCVLLSYFFKRVLIYYKTCIIRIHSQGNSEIIQEFLIMRLSLDFFLLK